MADKSDISQLKLLESGRKARELLNKLNAPYLTSREMSDVIALVAVESSELHRVIDGLDAINRYGAREAVRSHSSYVQPIGLNATTVTQVDEASDHEPWLIPNVRAQFESIVRVQFNFKMNSLDPLSQLGALAFEDERNSEKWISINPLAWTAWAGKGNNCIVRGAVKRGKSNLALLLAELFLATKHFVIVSNIIVAGAPESYIYCPRLSDMLKAICDARLANKDVLIILDEGGLFWAKVETIMPVPIRLAKLILVYGKCHANLVFISHYSEQIPGIVSKTSVANFEKKSLKEVYVEVTDGIRIKPRLLTAVPACTLKYDPDQLAYFSIDMSVDALFNFMSSIPEGSDQWKALLVYIAKHRGETGEEQLDPKEIALWLRKRGKSEREIAEIVKRSPSTVHGWVTGV